MSARFGRLRATEWRLCFSKSHNFVQWRFNEESYTQDHSYIWLFLETEENATAYDDYQNILLSYNFSFLPFNPETLELFLNITLEYIYKKVLILKSLRDDSGHPKLNPPKHDEANWKSPKGQTCKLIKNGHFCKQKKEASFEYVEFSICIFLAVKFSKWTEK